MKSAGTWSRVVHSFFKPPPPVGAGGGYMFSGRPSVPLSVRPCVRAYVRPSVRDSRGSFMFPQYLQYLLTDFRQTFVTGASRDKDELIRFWGQKVKVQFHGMTECIPYFFYFFFSLLSVVVLLLLLLPCGWWIKITKCRFSKLVLRRRLSSEHAWQKEEEEKDRKTWEIENERRRRRHGHCDALKTEEYGDARRETKTKAAKWW